MTQKDIDTWDLLRDAIIAEDLTEIYVDFTVLVSLICKKMLILDHAQERIAIHIKSNPLVSYNHDRQMWKISRYFNISL